jgi:hypothetical protein
VKRTLLASLIVTGSLIGCTDGGIGLGGGGTGAGNVGAIRPDGIAGDGIAGLARPTAGFITGRIRNFTDQSAEVTLRFLLGDFVVHLTFVRVPAHTSTTIIGPELAERLEVWGVAQDGRELPAAVYRLGVELADGGEAVYVIGPVEPAADVPPTLTFVLPIADVEVLPGGQLEVIISDEDPDSAATISFFLDPGEQPLDGDEIALGAGFREDLDGTADTFSFVLGEDVRLGDYRLLGVISDELSTDIVQAPGLIHVVAELGDAIETPDGSAGNVLPSLLLIEPADDIEVLSGEVFDVAWIDDDPNDDAAISIFLDPNGDTFDGDEIMLASSIKEDLDGDGDRISAAPDDVAPGTYRVVGVISDGQDAVISVAPGAVTVLAPATNDPPVLAVTEPASNVAVRLDQALLVRWNDDDADDNAEITFYLDPDGVDLNGGEIRIGTFSEDPDGVASDQAMITMANLPTGSYEVFGTIADDEMASTARASGLVTALPRSSGNGGDPGDGGGDNGDGEDGLGHDGDDPPGDGEGSEGGEGEEDPGDDEEDPGEGGPGEGEEGPGATQGDPSGDDGDPMGGGGDSGAGGGGPGDAGGSGGADEPEIEVVLCGTFDFDHDEEVDLRDFAWFQICFVGSGEPYGNSASCLCHFDGNLDGLIDASDFALFYDLISEGADVIGPKASASGG